MWLFMIHWYKIFSVFFLLVYLHYLFVLQRVAQEAAADLVMTGDLPLMQLPMALLVEVVHQDRDPLVTVDILAILHKMVMWTLVPTLAAAEHLIGCLLLLQVLQVTNINRWLIGDCLTVAVLIHFWRVRLLPPHFIRSSQFFVSAGICTWGYVCVNRRL